jgi:hypothetical protein
VAAISPNMLQWVMQNFQKRLEECVDSKGHHLTHTIFRKWMLKLKCFELKIILVINLRKKIVYFSIYFNLKIVRFFCRTLYYDARIHEHQVYKNVCDVHVTWCDRQKAKCDSSPINLKCNQSQQWRQLEYRSFLIHLVRDTRYQEIGNDNKTRSFTIITPHRILFGW